MALTKVIVSMFCHSFLSKEVTNMTFIYLAKYIEGHNGARGTSILPSMLGKQKIARCMVLINCVLCACNVYCV